MTEEKIYDFESDWRPISNGLSKKIIYEHEKRKSLFRVIDMNKCSIRFSDLERVSKIVDINKVLTKESNSDELKEHFMPIVNAMIDDIRPISIPYEVDDLTCYIESFPGFDKTCDDILGILYFKDNKTDDMIECKKFFRVLPIGSLYRYEEIDFHTYHLLKKDFFERSMQDVDNEAGEKRAD